MAEKDKRYYWLKLKRDFFKRHDIKIIESMPNGKDYILFYLKLLCESVDHDGNLRFSEQIPYNEQMLSTITDTNVDIVRNAITIFSELGMMDILDDGTYYMNEVSKMMGSETYWAKQKRLQRADEGQIEDNDRTMSNKIGQCPTCPSKSKRKSIDKELEIDKELDKDNPPASPKGGTGINFKMMVDDTDFSEQLKTALHEWIDYKKEIKKPYKSERGFKQFINLVANYTLNYSDDEIISVINKTMASNYQGVVWDWLSKKEQKTGTSYVDAINNRMSVVDEWLERGD